LRVTSRGLGDVYKRQVLEGADIKDQVAVFVDDTLTAYVSMATSQGYSEDWDLETLWNALKTIYPISFTIEEIIARVGSRSGLDAEFLSAAVLEDCKAAYSKREESLGSEVMRELERKVLLSVLDRKWREHLYEMDYLQEGIGLRAMAQRDPLVEYQREGFDLFSAMMDAIKEEIAGFLFNIEVTVEASNNEVTGAGLEAKALPTSGLQYTAADENGVKVTGEVSRNAPCPCGSGKKFKRCHGGA
jgi:preprotein translocase subunit SecA